MQQCLLTDEHLEPIVCVYPAKAKKGEVAEQEMLCQIFNFVDTIGGKANLTAQSKYFKSVNIDHSDIERTFKIRGIFEPSSKAEAKELESALTEGL